MPFRMPFPAPETPLGATIGMECEGKVIFHKIACLGDSQARFLRIFNGLHASSITCTKFQSLNLRRTVILKRRLLALKDL